MNKHKEALQKIIEVTLDQSTANKIATEALQSESMMYSEDEVEKGMFWVLDNLSEGHYTTEEMKFSIKDYLAWQKTLKAIKQSLQPKTEELKEGLKPCPNHPDVLTSQCGICNGDFPKLQQPKTEEDTYRRICKEHDWVKLGEDKRQCTICGGIQEQPTSPSIEKMAELKKEFLYERHYYSSKERLWEFIEQVFEEGYKANNHLEELEKWVREERYHYGTDINSQELINKLYQLKTKP